jgi:hypothetical protein
MAPAAVALVSTADQSPGVCFPARHRGVATVTELQAVQTRIAALAAVELLVAFSDDVRLTRQLRRRVLV